MWLHIMSPCRWESTEFYVLGTLNLFLVLVLLQKFLTDLSASSKRIEALDVAVEEFVRQGHSQLDKVRTRQKQIHQLWDHLNWLKGQKERSLEGASR